MEEQVFKIEQVFKNEPVLVEEWEIVRLEVECTAPEEDLLFMDIQL